MSLEKDNTIKKNKKKNTKALEKLFVSENSEEGFLDVLEKLLNESNEKKAASSDAKLQIYYEAECKTLEKVIAIYKSFS